MRLLAPALLILWPAMAPLMAKDSCAECHSAMEGDLAKPATLFKVDVHGKHGLACADCHGGDASSDDPEKAMSKAKGFVGKPARTAVPKLCARCHSDANLMHKFKPQERVDQFELYQTSVHGKKLASGDTAVATCVDCHSVHDIREVKDALSPVHPLRLPETCARCHADKQHMAKYKIETNQFAEYRTSVHWEALSRRGDLSAPSCASCHGNHGATPPQVSSVAAICGTCHVLFEELYRKSPHQPAFAAMGEGSCTVCHSNHGIKQPNVGMLAGSDAVCAQCHEADSAGGKTAAAMADSLKGLQSALDRSDAVLKEARESGMEVSEAQLRQMEGREALVKARVAVHAFQLAAFQKPAGDGMKIAAETLRAGQVALHERQQRRVGLAVSLVFILITITGLWLAIRQLESKPAEAESPAGR